MKLRKRAGVGAGTMAAVVMLCCALIAFAQSGDSNAAQSAGPGPSKASAAAKAKPTTQSTTKVNVSAATKPATPAAKPADPNAVACHALEMHSNAQPAVTIVVFNQKDKDDHQRLSDLLKDNEGASVEIKSGDGKWHPASVARLKSCFGRGLLFFSGEASPVQEKDDFVLRFPAKKTS